MNDTYDRIMNVLLKSWKMENNIYQDYVKEIEKEWRPWRLIKSGKP